MIGSWDETDCVLALAFNAWSKGNGTSNQNSGEMPGYPNGDYDVTFTNMLSGYGYLYNAGDGYCNFDGNDDQIVTSLSEAFTNTSKHTWEIWFESQAGISQTIMAYNEDSNNEAFVGKGSNDKLYLWFYKSASLKYVQSTNTLSDGTYHLVFIKDGSTLKIYINGSEASYDNQDSYTLGNKTFVDGLNIGYRERVSQYFVGHLYTINIYNDAISEARISANYALGKDMGLVGNNAGDIMALSESSEGILLPKSSLCLMGVGR